MGSAWCHINIRLHCGCFRLAGCLTVSWAGSAYLDWPKSIPISQFRKRTWECMFHEITLIPCLKFQVSSKISAEPAASEATSSNSVSPWRLQRSTISFSHPTGMQDLHVFVLPEFSGMAELWHFVMGLIYIYIYSIIYIYIEYINKWLKWLNMGVKVR